MDRRSGNLPLHHASCNINGSIFSVSGGASAEHLPHHVSLCIAVRLGSPFRRFTQKEHATHYMK
jgi:hypothetical protein